MGMKQAEKSGLGIYSVKAGTFPLMTAIVVVNALGDISDYETGKENLPDLRILTEQNISKAAKKRSSVHNLAICSLATQQSVRL